MDAAALVRRVEHMQLVRIERFIHHHSPSFSIMSAFVLVGMSCVAHVPALIALSVCVASWQVGAWLCITVYHSTLR